MTDDFNLDARIDDRIEGLWRVLGDPHMSRDLKVAEIQVPGGLAAVGEQLERAGRSGVGEAGRMTNDYSQAVAVCEAIEEAVWAALDSGLTPDEVRAEVEAAIRTAEAA